MYGHGWRVSDYAPAPPGIAYAGPCRCGRGPHAYYLDRRGRFVHARCIPWWETSGPGLDTDRIAELDALREEKMNLERRIQVLEDSMKER